MQIIKPSSSNLTSLQQVLRWAQSVYKATTHAIAFGQPNGQDSFGVYDNFIQDNIDCVLLYIGHAGSGAPITWAANNIGQAINHGLQRQPIGFIVVYKTKTCDVYSTATPTVNTITLAITDDTAQTTIMVF